MVGWGWGRGWWGRAVNSLGTESIVACCENRQQLLKLLFESVDRTQGPILQHVFQPVCSANQVVLVTPARS